MTRLAHLPAVATIVLGLTGGSAFAQAPPTPDKVDAKALMQSGLKLFEAKDYLGALAVFKDAYARFPSAKILLNIGTTEALLDRKADAANSYQKYLDSGDADPAKRAAVAAQITEFDRSSGLLELAITPADAEIQLDPHGRWVPAGSVKVWRVVPGAYTIRARKQGFQPGQQQDSIAAGAKATVTIALAAIPEPEKQVIVTVPVESSIEPEGPRSRIGALVLAHVSVLPKLGSALFLGATGDVTEQLAIDAAVILGPGLVNQDGSASRPPPKLGVYAGASFAFLDGPTRPRVSAGMPIFFDDGARFFVRAAGGVEYVASPHLSFEAELGAELDLNAAMDIKPFALVPSIGLAGRL
jgi:hypothetical protein